MQRASSEAEKMKQMTQKSNHCSRSHLVVFASGASYWSHNELAQSRPVLAGSSAFQTRAVQLRELDLVVFFHRDFKPQPNRNQL
jgi:hypothetical protein